MTLLRVSVKPGAKRPGATFEGGILVLRVRERAVNGAANDGCVRALADLLAIAPSAIVLQRGARGRTKTFHISALTEPQLRARLAERFS